MDVALLDRDAELDALERQLGALRAGAGRVAAVEGPAGIGKSSLLRAAARAAESRGIVVLRARGGPLEQDAAWGIARQLFEPLRSRADWGDLTAGAAALSQRALDPHAPEPAPAGDAVHAAVHGLVWLACTLAERAPALLVVDDVHWADAASLRWLVQLARRLEEQPLGVLCAVRTGEPPGDSELLAELLAHLAAERVTPDAATAERLSAFGPEQVARTVERQLARLTDGAAALARALAVVGHDALLRHAARLARLDVREAAHASDALRAAGLVHGEAEIALAHPLIAAALYSSLARGERSLWHADAAQMLSAEGADPQLFVTRRTVETRLTHAFQKLDISNRDQLATSLTPVRQHAVAS